jgi:hypothetical protein
MRILKKTLTLSLAFGLSLLALSLTTTPSVAAEAATETETNYVYTAKAGDSYTELARSSLIKYDLDTEEVQLNAAQVTAAETWVTQEAGSPAINVGQEVSVSKASVEKFAKQAAELSDAAKARWQTYADASSITNTSLDEQVRTTTSEDEAMEMAEQEAQAQASDEAANQDEQSDEAGQSSSRRWVILAVVALLVLAAVSLVRSSNQKDE